jgi:hypothetical protein
VFYDPKGEGREGPIAERLKRFQQLRKAKQDE